MTQTANDAVPAESAANPQAGRDRVIIFDTTMRDGILYDLLGRFHPAPR